MTFADKIRDRIKEVPDFPKPGISFKDITPLLFEPELYPELIDEIAKPFANEQVDFVAGMESRGFLYGMGLAHKLGAGFIPIRKKGKLPRPTHTVSYDLEYGSAELELHREDIPRGSRVLIHDDLLATGGTASAALQLIQKMEAEVVGLCFIIELDFLNGRERLGTRNLHSLVHY
ncbi:MAG: adenine phosphoribosyltransferase [Owenweeksia sp.]